MMMRHWKIPENTYRKFYPAAIQRSRRDGCRAVMGDDFKSQTRVMKRVEIEDGRMASDVTAMLMGTDVPPRKAFIYEHANDAILDV